MKPGFSTWPPPSWQEGKARANSKRTQATWIFLEVVSLVSVSRLAQHGHFVCWERVVATWLIAISLSCLAPAILARTYISPGA